jgi:hypothetical protein
LNVNGSSWDLNKNYRILTKLMFKMDLREIGWDGVDWIGLIWLRIGTSGGLL